MEFGIILSVSRDVEEKKNPLAKESESKNKKDDKIIVGEIE